MLVAVKGVIVDDVPPAVPVVVVTVDGGVVPIDFIIVAVVTIV